MMVAAQEAERKRERERDLRVEAEEIRAKKRVKEETDRRKSLEKKHENRPPEGDRLSENKLKGIREELRSLYLQFEPSKANKVNKLLRKYAGNEIEFVQHVREKYKSVSAKGDELQVSDDRFVRGEEVDL